MDFRKMDMINNINDIMIILMLELLKWSPAIPGFGFKHFAFTKPPLPQMNRLTSSGYPSF